MTERRRKSRRGGSDAPVAAVAAVAEIGGILRGAAGRMIVTVNKRLSYRTRRLMKGLTGTRRLIRPDLRAYLTAPQPFFLALYFSLD
jgi:hypothetical protein